MKNIWPGLAVALAVVIAGCSGKSETTVLTTPDGKMTVTESGEGQKVTMQSGDGTVVTESDKDGSKVTVTDDKGNTSTMSSALEADLSKFPLSLPADAKPKPGDAGYAELSTSEATSYTVTLVTDMSLEQVANHFKALVENPTVTSAPTGAMVIGKTKEGHEVIMAAARDAGETKTTLNLSVTVAKKKP